MRRGLYRKLFFDLDKAEEFGKVIDSAARQFTVPAGKAGNPFYIFGNRNNYWELGPFKEKEPPAVFHYVEKETGIDKRDIYYVRYYIERPVGSTRADMMQVERQAKEYLDQKYKELGPDAGISR